MIRHYTGTKLTPKQLASHIVADYGCYGTFQWLESGTIWEETRVGMTKIEIKQTEVMIQKQIQRVINMLNLKYLD
jgi:hypothetical protein